MSEEFIGRGIAFPLRVDATGGLAVVEREREIEEAIRLILATSEGERPMRPDFGCRIHDHIFASPDQETRGRIAHEVRQSLRRWEPRIDVRSVEVTPDPGEPSTLFIDISYAIRGTNDPRNLVFPFYTIPEERPVIGQVALAQTPFGTPLAAPAPTTTRSRT
jgi:phage baseplate assembly protein W